jgi:3-hydroxyacyl-CoA dehydrogenase / enoyl-CoA hydratase / 3-hydroxybutyryl-CoA epimerase
MIESKKQVILRKRASGVGVVLFDSPGRSNLLTTEVLQELEHALAEVSEDSGIKALMLLSGKHDTFLSGADLHEILRFENRDAAFALSRRGQAVLDRISNLGKPVVVGINGACLGGGLELALACDRRIATTSGATQLGLPEVRLGLIPGLGGTQRLPRLIGVKGALEIILSSEPISAVTAKEMGIVDDVVAPDELMARLEQEALALLHAQEIGARFGYDAAANPKDPQLLNMAERSVRIKTKGHYPAHTRVINVIRDGLANGMETGLQLEAETFADLAVGEVARNLIFLFFTSEFARQSAAAQVKKSGIPEVETVGVIGGGNMGGGIAQLAALSGHKVLVSEMTEERARAAVEQIRNRLSQQRPSNSQPESLLHEAAAAVNHVPSTDGMAGADLVIEAVFEDLELKGKIFNQLVDNAKDDCVFASNTSSLSLSEIAARVKSPQRVVGLHFFHPVDKMPLIEVINQPDTAPWAMARAMSFVSKLGKVPVLVKDGPGFLVNRLLCCYLAEAGKLAEEKVPMNWIDDAAVAFGMPMGPLALLDEVGLDIAYKVSSMLHERCGDRLAPPAVFQKVEQLGLIGKKAGVGLYLWEDGRKQSFNPQLIQAASLVVTETKPDPDKITEICDRLVLPMIDEAARCLSEKIVRKPRELDMSMILGIGFPAFRGGPLRYADTRGIPDIVENLIAMQPATGRTVSPLLATMSSTGRRFYSSAPEAD